MQLEHLLRICFYCGQGKTIEREWPSVPRIGEVVINEFGSFVVADVHWEDDVIGVPYVHIHLETREAEEIKRCQGPLF